jgi:hypothetical protein
MNNLEIKSYLLKQFKSRIRDSDELDARIKRFTLDSLRSFNDLKSELKRIYSTNDSQGLSVYYRDNEDELVEIENDNDMQHAFNQNTLVNKVYITLKQNEIVAAQVKEINFNKKSLFPN